MKPSGCTATPEREALADILRAKLARGEITDRQLAQEYYEFAGRLERRIRATQSASTATSGGLVNTLRNMAASSWAATYEHDHVLKQAADRIERLEQRVVQVEQSRVALSATGATRAKIIEECYIEVAACNGDGFEAERRLRVLIHRADRGSDK